MKIKINIVLLVFSDGTEDWHAIYDNNEAEDFVFDMKFVKELKKLEKRFVELPEQANFTFIAKVKK